MELTSILSPSEIDALGTKLESLAELVSTLCETFQANC